MGLSVGVIGGGIYGQVVAWRLAERQADVTLIEPLGPGNADSASGDRSRIVRAMYDEMSFAEAGHASMALWRAWGDALGTELVRTCGVIYFDRDDEQPAARAFREWLDRGLTNLRSLGAQPQVLSAGEVTKRYPAISPERLRRAVFEPDAGFGFSAQATQAIARAATEAGATAVVGRVVGLSSSANRWVMHLLDAADIEVDRVVVAAGLSGAGLVEQLTGRSLGIRRLPHYTSYWHVPGADGAMLAEPSLPAWADLGADLYGFPDEGGVGFKMAWHQPRRSADRAEVDEHAERPSRQDLDGLRRATAVRFPALEHATLRSTYQCAYDATDDENFQIGWVPGAAGIYLVGGLSGHGYKHAPALGDRSAEVVVTGVADQRLAPFAVRWV